jgi:hypothetical protein
MGTGVGCGLDYALIAWDTEAVSSLAVWTASGQWKGRRRPLQDCDVRNDSQPSK